MRHAVLPKETKEQTRKRNVEAIMNAAEIVFAEHGYRGSSLSMIAKMAEVPKSNITYYFSSKEALYKEVLSNICLLWLEAGDEISEENDPFQALTSYIHHKMDLARKRPYGSKVWANEVIHGAPFIGNYLQSTVKDWVSQRTRVMERWIEKGLLRNVDPTHVFFMIWATTQHYADFDSQIRILNDHDPLNDAQWASAKNTVVQTIMDGLRPECEK